VSKQEVRSWPLIGWLTRLAGTIYLDRKVRKDAVRAGTEVCERTSEGTVVCIFPEGTSSDGREVLPFRAPLLQPAIEQGWQVTPAHLSYELSHGSVADEVCYWRDMSFPAHLWNLLGKDSLTARVIYGGAHPPASDRKLLASRLHESVRQLAARTSASLSPSEV
jgi:1-acyl-sn-glycerol-3-phosphate acyltransferase